MKLKAVMNSAVTALAVSAAAITFGDSLDNVAEVRLKGYLGE